jgi:hypothetical protein
VAAATAGRYTGGITEPAAVTVLSAYLYNFKVLATEVMPLKRKVLSMGVN